MSLGLRTEVESKVFRKLEDRTRCTWKQLIRPAPCWYSLIFIMHTKVVYHRYSTAAHLSPPTLSSPSQMVHTRPSHRRSLEIVCYELFSMSCTYFEFILGNFCMPTTVSKYWISWKPKSLNLLTPRGVYFQPLFSLGTSVVTCRCVMALHCMTLWL